MTPNPWVGHTKLATIASLYLIAFVRLEGACYDWNADHIHTLRDIILFSGELVSSNAFIGRTFRLSRLNTLFWELLF